MNKHIELVEKWLADGESVSLEELKANKEAAEAAYDDADAAYHDAHYADAADAAYYAYYAAYYAAEYVDNAQYYVKKYKELTQ